jgi:hypothetical protein
MDAWQVVTLALAALLVGVLLPAAVQLTLALRAWRATAVRAEQALVAATAAAERVERLTARLEEGGRMERLLGALDGLSGMASRVQEAARVAGAVGAAVGPAVGAAVRAWRDSRVEGPPANGGEPPPQPHSDGKDAGT